MSKYGAEIMEKYQPGEHDKTAGVLQADETVLQQADGGRKIMTDPDYSKIRAGKKLCATKREEKIVNGKLIILLGMSALVQINPRSGGVMKQLGMKYQLNFDGTENRVC